MARYVEKYDRANLEKLVNITHEDMESIWKQTDKDIKGEDTDIKTQTLLIRKLCREALKNGGSREVVYKYSKKLGDKGRLYADGPSPARLRPLPLCMMGRRSRPSDPILQGGLGV